MLLSLLADTFVLNGALLVEHNVALYLERCSGSVGSIDMDHCSCNAPQIYSARTICTWRDRFKPVWPFEKELAWHKWTECIKSLTRLLKILLQNLSKGHPLLVSTFSVVFGPHCHNYAFRDHKKCIKMCQDAPLPSANIKENFRWGPQPLLDHLHWRDPLQTPPPCSLLPLNPTFQNEDASMCITQNMENCAILLRNQTLTLTPFLIPIPHSTFYQPRCACWWLELKWRREGCPISLTRIINALTLSCAWNVIRRTLHGSVLLMQY